MRVLRRLRDQKTRFDLVAGLCDGIITALTLASGRMLNADAPLKIDLALRVATAAAVSGAFILFVAHYATFRGELAEAERQLNFTAHGRLARSRLGRVVLIESARGSLLSGTCCFCGALIPLMAVAVVPTLGWLVIAIALAALALFGIFLAKTVHGRPLLWAVGLLAGGITLAVVGMYLKVV